MFDPAKALYHLSPHQPQALLGPVAASLTEIETRLAHYAERVRMTDADRALIQRAHELVAAARAGVIAIALDARTSPGDEK